MAASGSRDTAADPRAGSPVRSPWGPCLLAWIFPGAGHLAIGRIVPGLVFSAVIFTCFGTGLALSGTVYALDRDQPLSYVATFANVGAGPIDVWARWSTYGSLRYRIPDSRLAPEDRERVLRRLRRKIGLRSHAYGRTFLLTAGLMNMLLILDVYDWRTGRKGGSPTRGPLGEVPAQGEIVGP